jgi:nitroimidazol reductase NimA-like FMN-containing flavoprotein (pyridoxamine 5'-phosphate oxidase superfamily)
MTQVKFDEKELEFLKRDEICRVATSSDNVPHVTPVNYIFDKGFVFFATDYETKKFKNLFDNKRIAVTIDTYGPNESNKAVIIFGTAEIIEKGDEFKRLYEIFDKKFKWVGADPWGEGEAPFVKIIPERKVSWGMK